MEQGNYDFNCFDGGTVSDFSEQINLKRYSQGNIDLLIRLMKEIIEAIVG